jgi:hypothetical protein
VEASTQLNVEERVAVGGTFQFEFEDAPLRGLADESPPRRGSEPLRSLAGWGHPFAAVIALQDRCHHGIDLGPTGVLPCNVVT